jgi:hypothetical protein
MEPYKPYTVDEVTHIILNEMQEMFDIQPHELDGPLETCCRKQLSAAVEANMPDIGYYKFHELIVLADDNHEENAIFIDKLPIPEILRDSIQSYFENLILE